MTTRAERTARNVNLLIARHRGARDEVAARRIADPIFEAAINGSKIAEAYLIEVGLVEGD